MTATTVIYEIYGVHNLSDDGLLAHRTINKKAHEAQFKYLGRAYKNCTFCCDEESPDNCPQCGQIFEDHGNDSEINTVKDCYEVDNEDQLRDALESEHDPTLKDFI